MKVLIIGCGYLGQRAGAMWLAGGAQVSCLTRSADRAEQFSRAGFSPIVGDVLDDRCLAHAGSFDACLYAVGFDRTAVASKHEVYVTGLRRVLEQLAGRCQRVLYISSTSVYGQDSGEWVDEMSPCQPTSEGGQICLEAESVVRGSAWGSTGSATILRLSGIYGPGRFLARAEMLKRGEALSGSGEAWLNLIHVADAANAAVLWSNVPNPEPVLLLSDDRPIRRSEYYSKLAELYEAPPPNFAEAEAGLTGINKRCRNDRAKSALGLTLMHPDFTSALG